MIITKKKRIALFCLFFVLTVVWMAAIFGFSSKDASESTKQSNVVTRFVLSILNPDFADMTEQQQQEFISQYDGIIRKLAHFAAYTILGIFSYGAAGWLGWIPTNIFLPIAISVPVSVIFSCTDEFHQTFVSGRAGRISDVLIDSGGVIFGTVLFIVVIKIALHNYRKKRM